MLQFLGIQHIRHAVIMDIAHGHQVFLLLMFHHRGDEIVDLSRSAKEHLTFTILDILLNIERYRLRHTKILHVLGNGDTHLFCQREIVVNGMTRSENNSSIVENGDLLCTKLLGCDSLYLNKRAEH